MESDYWALSAAERSEEVRAARELLEAARAEIRELLEAAKEADGSDVPSSPTPTERAPGIPDYQDLFGWEE